MKNLRENFKALSWGLISATLVLQPTVAQAQFVQRSFFNPSFEQPVFGSPGQQCYVQVLPSTIPYWQTTHGSVKAGGGNCTGYTSPGTVPLIEIWTSGFQSVSTATTPTSAGNQFAELNAEQASELYQNVCVIKNETISFSFLHRARSSATVPDVVNFLIGLNTDPKATVFGKFSTTSNGTVTAQPVAQNGATIPTVSNNNAGNGWVRYTGTVPYTGTSGIQPVGFAAVSTSDGNNAAGNFLDQVQFAGKPVAEFTTSSGGGAESETNPTTNPPQFRIVGLVPTGGISVPISVSGTAVLGTDYKTTSGTSTFNVTVPAGNYDGSNATSVFTIPFTVINDNIAQGTRTIVFTLQPSSSFFASSTTTCGGNPIAASTYTIYDDDFVSGKVWDDADNSANNTFTNINTGSETGTNAGGLLNAILVDSNNKVLVTAPVAADGTYTFTNVPLNQSNVKIILSTTAGTVGNTAPTASLPPKWVSTSPLTTATFNTGTNISNHDFGIEQLPTAVGGTATSQANPTGTNTVTVASTLFTGSTDPDGTVASYKITAFPSNTTSITINGTNYTSASFPVAGVTVTTAQLTGMVVDPVDGAVTVSIPFQAIDNAGQISTNPATANLPFSAAAVTVSGTVFDDADGSKVKNGSEVLSTATGLNAVLVDTSTSKVVATTPVSSGAFSFSNVPANSTYTVRITTATATVGSTPPAVTLPSGWVSTGENLNGTVDGTVDGIISVPVTTSNVTGVNIGIEQLPTGVGGTATSQANPTGTNTVTVASTLFTGSTDPDGTVASYKITAFPSNTTSIKINGTNYTSASFPVGGVTVTTAQLTGMVVDPVDGAVTVSIPFQAIDNAGQISSNPATANLPFSAAAVTVSGTVFDDADGSKVQNGSEVLSTATGLNAVLVDTSTGKVVATTAVSSGAFSFSNVPANSTYTVRITTATATVGSTPPAVTLPSGWVSTGENLNGTPDGTVDGIISVPVTTSNVTGVNIGIEQLPTAVGGTATSQANPTGTNTVTVASTLFTGSTDPDGTVASYKITAFPSNTTSITINGTNYTSASFPVAGVTVTSAQLTGMVVDPVDGAVTVSIPFQAIDNAGQISTNPATANLPFSAAAVTVSGTVFDDADGSKVQNGTEAGSNAGGLNAVLIDSTNKVSAITAVAANGTYTFNNVPTNANYTVEITTATATVGSAPPAVTLPSNWVSMGENLNGAIDGTVDSKQSVAVATSNVSGVNFGIEQLPNTTDVTASSQTNPGNTTTVQVPSLAGTDPEDGALGSGKSFKIVTLPTNGTLYYNGTAATVGQVIANYDPTKLTIAPASGSITVSFTYAAVDAAGQADPTPGTVTMPFTAGTCTNSAGDGAYATTGIRKNSIWWLNFECYDDTTAATASGQPFSFTLPDGSTMTLTVNKTGSGTSGIKTVTPPTWGGAAFGNGYYNGIPGKSAFYATTTPTGPYMWQETLTNITVTDKAGNLRNYGFVVADGESTGAGGGAQEQLTFNTNGGTPWSLLEIIQQSGTSAVLAGTGTSTATWTGSGSNVNGSVLLSTTSPTQVSVKSQPMGNGGGAEGALFGIALPKITLIKNINGRVNTSDQFTTEIDYTSPTVRLTTATTSGSATTSTTGPVSVLPGNVINLKETMVAGSPSSLTAYNSSIACVQNATVATTTVFPSGLGNSFNITPQVGDDITCTITNQTKPGKSQPQLILVKRITSVNGIPFNQFVHDPTSTDDNDPNWPSPASTYLRGAIDGGLVKPGDQLEYTIYFLSKGLNDATNVSICDPIPNNTTFIPTTFNGLTPTDGGLPGANLGIALALDSTKLPTTPTVYLSNVADADRGQFFSPGTTLPVACLGNNNTNGAVVINAVKSPSTLPAATASGTPTNSYGFVRFRVMVK